MDINIRLQELRQTRKMTQKQLADRMGVAVSTISAYETGSNKPPYEILLLYANIFHVTTDYILGRDNSISSSINVEGLCDKEVRAIQALIDELRKSN